jgi:CubicO group peptidase (beta-lactamase class C family)
MTTAKTDVALPERRMTVRHDGVEFPIAGRCAPEFTRVFDAFVANFAAGEELGASCAIFRRGRLVVDLWGGWADEARTRPWVADTLCNTMSVTKAMTALCLHVLVDRGQVALDAPVARYWPEFAANGKAGILVRWLLDQRAGLPVLQEDLWPGAIMDWTAMTQALARQPALVAPGTTAAYHIRTAGFLVGEVVRRVSGRSLGTFFREEIAAPLGLDFHIGLGEAEMARCADFVAQRSGTLLDPALVAGDTLASRISRQMPARMDYNGAEYRRAEIPSTNGHGNARSVARFYALLAAGGTLDGVRILAPRTIEAARVEQHRDREIILQRSYRQALGFLLNTPGDFPIGPNPNAYGLLGMGGAVGFCDPDAELAFGYVENRMHKETGLGPRAPRLFGAMYAS